MWTNYLTIILDPMEAHLPNPLSTRQPFLGIKNKDIRV
jgi:hypothetical protein